MRFFMGMWILKRRGHLVPLEAGSGRFFGRVFLTFFGWPEIVKLDRKSVFVKELASGLTWSLRQPQLRY